MPISGVPLSLEYLAQALEMSRQKVQSIVEALEKRKTFYLQYWRGSKRGLSHRCDCDSFRARKTTKTGANPFIFGVEHKSGENESS